MSTDTTGRSSDAYTLHRQAPGRCGLVRLILMPAGGIVLATGALICCTVGWSTPGNRWVVQILWASTATMPGAILSGAVLAAATRWCPTYVGQAALGGMSMRMVSTLGSVMILIVTVPDMGRGFVLSCAVFYVIALVIETALAVTVVRQDYFDQLPVGAASRKAAA